MKQSSMHLTRLCSAPPDVVYDFLADLGTHMTWGGNQQTSDFRLLSLEAPAGSASAGTTFTSTGSSAAPPTGLRMKATRRLPGERLVASMVEIQEPIGALHRLVVSGLPVAIARELIALAERVPAGRLGHALAAWQMRHETSAQTEARQHAARMGDEERQQLELLRRQPDLVAIPEHRAAIEIHRQISTLELTVEGMVAPERSA